MALIALFFQSRAQLGVLELDVSLKEGHSATAQMTKSETEDASVKTDHVILDPRKLTIEGLVSKSPLGTAGLVGSAFSSLAGVASKASENKAVKGAITTGIASLGGLVGSAVGGSAGVKSREPKDVYGYLIELWRNRLPFDVVTALTKYEDMIMTSLEVPRDISTVEALRFTATLEQIKIVRTQVVSLSQTPGAAASQNLGKQAPGAASAKSEVDASIAWKIEHGVF